MCMCTLHKVITIFKVIAAVHLFCISYILFYITSLKLLKVLLTIVTGGKLSI